MNLGLAHGSAQDIVFVALASLRDILVGEGHLLTAFEMVVFAKTSFIFAFISFRSLFIIHLYIQILLLDSGDRFRTQPQVGWESISLSVSFPC